jgi:hypothetical protein
MCYIVNEKEGNEKKNHDYLIKHFFSCFLNFNPRLNS